MLPYNYAQAQAVIHRAVQLLTLIGNNLAVPKPDDSQNTSRLLPASGSLVGETFQLNETSLTAKIELHDLALVIEGAGQRLNLEGLTWKSAKQWIKDLFHIRELKGIHYELDFTLIDAYTFPDLEEEQLKHWIAHRSLANEALQHLNRSLCAYSEPRIWPHHFDTGTYYELATDETGKVVKTIGAGFAVADAIVSEPYFYLYGWDHYDQLSYENRATLPAGKWILKDHWQGVVLPISSIPEEREDFVFQFLDTAQAWYKKALRE
ncbi:MAG: hypothetical protein AAFU60_09330 [Bacteroidota bacterium]